MRVFGITAGIDPVHPVIVNTIDGNSFRGVMVDRNRSLVILRAVSIYAEVQNGAHEWKTVQGDVAIPWANISWWQEGLPAEAVLT